MKMCDSFGGRAARPRPRRRRLLSSCLASALLAGPAVPGVCRGVDATWNSTTGGNWSVASNWNTNPLIPNAVGDQAKFIANSAFTLTITQNVPGLTLGAMQINNIGSVQITGSNALTMDNSAPNAVLTVGSSVGNGAHVIATNVVLNDPLSLTQSSAGEFTFSGAVSGAGGLIKNGVGSVRLGGGAANTFAGDTRVNAGTLRLFKTANLNAIGGNLIVGDDVGGANADLVTIANDALPDACNLTVNSAGRLEVQSPELVQNVTMKSGNIVIGGGGPSLLMNGQLQTLVHAEPATISGAGSLELFGGTKIINVADGAAANDLVISARISTGGLDKRGAGTLVLSGDNTYTGPTIVAQGKVVVEATMTRSSAWTLEDGAAVVLTAGGSKVIKNTTLTLNGSARLDLSDNKLITRSDIGTASGGTYTGVQGLVQSGRNAGAWNGSGIVTSMPDAASGLTSLGVATAEQAGYAGGTFGGVTVSAGDVLVMYTYAGDANLDGFISGDDYSAIDFASGTPGASGWTNGDFNWDGIISGDDYSAIDFNLVAQGAPIPVNSMVVASDEITAVPEPGVSAIVWVVVGAAAARRRRRDRAGVSGPGIRADIVVV